MPFTFQIVPRLPKSLEPLHELAYNLWWSWEPSARRLFKQIDPVLWEKTNHNPIQTLQLTRQSRLSEMEEDPAFLGDLEKVYSKLRTYLDPARTGTYGLRRAEARTDREENPRGPLIAYFSAEFGFHESVPNYSGGLGILSGDHCKSASDLDLNFCAVGLL